MAILAVSGLALTSCSPNEDEIQEIVAPAVVTAPMQNETINYRKTDSIPETNATNSTTPPPPGDGTGDTTLPPKKT